MAREPAKTAEAGEPNDTREILTAIEAQGRQTLDLVRAIIGLLLPKEGSREGPTLEELLAAIMAQQRDIIMLGRKTQADLIRLGETLPAAVAQAVESRAEDAWLPPS